MHRLQLTVIALLSAVLLTGCGSSFGNSGTSAPSAHSSEVRSSNQANGAIPPKPDSATQAKFIAELNAIDPEIVHGKEDKAVDRARNQCTSVKVSPGDQAKLVELTNKRFSAPGHPDGFGKDKAAKILDAVRKHICPEW